jgi:hypothetical protein
MTAPPTIADLADDIREGLRSGIFDGGSERRDRDDAHAALDILRARAETWEATANTWRTFAADVAGMTGVCDPDDVGIEDLRGLAGAVERLRARAEAAEAALVLACPHCGPEHFAGPDADGTCVMCMGALIRTDAAGAVLAHELYNGAHVAEAALATARAEGAAAERAAWLAELRSDLLNLKVIKADAEDYVRELIEDIEAGAHVRPVEGA